MKNILLVISLMLTLHIQKICAQPSNDVCTNAITLTPNACTSISGATYTIQGATQSIPPISCNGTAPIAHDVWFKFTATSTYHKIVVLPTTGLDAVVDLRSGSCNGTNIACADNGGGVGKIETINYTGFTIGQTYYIRVYDSKTPTSYGFDIFIITSNPVSNDNCSGAITLTPSSSCNYTQGSIGGATTSGLSKASCDYFTTYTPHLQDVWYKFTAYSSAQYNIIVTPSSCNTYCGFDPVVSLYSSCGGGQLDCEDNGSGVGNEETLTYNCTSGTTYYIRVYDYGQVVPMVPTFNICVTTTSSGCTPVSITTHPSDKSAIVGGTATYTVAAYGTIPIVYQWRKNGTNISGAPNSYSYTTPTLNLSDNGSTYSCYLTNCSGINNATSYSANLTVTSSCTPVNITTHPSDKSAIVGGNATFTVATIGTIPIVYQWRKNGTNISGAPNSYSYTTPTLNLSDNGSTYSCYLTNCSGINYATSYSANLTVTSSCTPVSITTHPSDKSAIVGGTATYTVAAYGTIPIVYQWRKNGTNISGAPNSPTYTTPTLNLSDNGSTYSCYLTNCGGINNATSTSANLTVTSSCTPVSITTHPKNQAANVGGTATFSIVAGGSDPKVYQWRKNGTDISGAPNSNSYTTPTLSLSDAGSSYSCYVTNCSGSNALSYTATLSVNPVKVYWMGIYTDRNPNPLTKGTSLEAANDMLMPAKICADGSKATRIDIKCDDKSYDVNNIEFRIGRFFNPNSQDYSGAFNEPYIKINDIRSTHFNHPTFMNLDAFFRPDTIIAYDKITNKVLFAFPIHIYRSPILFVHGWRDNDVAFEKMMGSDLQQAYSLKSPMVYPENNAAFFINRFQIPAAIERNLDNVSYNYSAGKVSIVAHSMGGVLSRLYLQSAWSDVPFQNDVDRLITLNTPHSGSQGANLVAYLLTGFNVIISPFSDKLTGAALDMRVNSWATRDVLNGPTLNNNSIPCHAIVTKISNDYNYDCDLFGIPLSVIKQMTLGDLLRSVYYDPTYLGDNDVVVSVLSQLGGLNGDNKSLFSNLFHTWSTKNQPVIQKVDFLLKQNPKGNYFSQTGFNPAVIGFKFSLRGSEPTFKNEIIDGSISILSPLKNSNYISDQNIVVIVEAKQNINNVVLVIENESLPITSLKQNGGGTIAFNYKIPKNAVGLVKFIAFGFDDDGMVDYDTLKIHVNIPANITLDSISTQPKSMYLYQYDTEYYSLTGYYSDGILRPIKIDTNVFLSANNLEVARNILNERILGKTIDTTSFSVSYLGKSTQMFVKVLKPLTNITAVNKNNLGKSFQLVCYPNPFNKTTLLSYHLPNKSNVTIEVFNLFGQLIKPIQSSNENEGQQIHEIDLSDKPDGIYFYTVTINDQIFSGKIIKAQH